MFCARLKLLLAISALPTLVGCGKPDIRIDATELENSNLANTSVGLLESKRANSGNTFGMQIGESQGESAFCSATLLADNTLLTSSDCLGNRFGKFKTESMLFHFKRPQSPITESAQIQEILSVDEEKKIALLVPAGNLVGSRLASSISLQTITPPAAELSANLHATVVSVAGPDKNGVSVIKVSKAVVETARASARVNIPVPSATTTTQTQTAAQAIEEIFSKPQGVVVTGIRDGSLGAPIFYQGKIVGITKGAPAAEDETDFRDEDEPLANAQWLIKR